MLTEGSGQWIRAGMNGQIIGLDIKGCMARPSAQYYDAEVIELLLLAGERGVLKAMSEKDKED